MIKRWLIRSLALTLLTLCVAAWVASYTYRMGVEHVNKDGFDGICMDFEGGKLILIRPIGSGKTDGRALQHREEWLDFFVVPWYSNWFSRRYSSTQYHFGGFAYGHGFLSWPGGTGWVVMLPMWFLTSIFGLFCGFAWRKTRPKPTGRAFPVEPAKPGESKP